ncbi:MAG: AEC family transporter [Magnetococcales bacterium]|nr:AEC family transporter [Magnetococcales bacterium]
MANTLLIPLLLGLGMLLARRERLPPSAPQVLTRFVIDISLPAMILVQLSRLAPSGELLVPLLMPWAMLALSAGVVLLARPLWRRERAITGALLLLVPLGNTSFLGLPMIEAILGAEALPYGILYDQLGSFPALATYGSVIVALFATGVPPPTPGAVARRLFTFPPFLTLLVGALLVGARLLGFLPPMPGLIALLDKVAASLVPVVMVAVGLQLRIRIPRENLLPLAFGLTTKLILAPLAALAISRLLGWEGEATRVAIFEAGMPPMITAGALAIDARLAPKLVAALVGFGILFAFVTLPLWPIIMG